VLPKKHVVYVGAVGKDQLADQLRAANDKVSLMTGSPATKAIEINGNLRSLHAHTSSSVRQEGVESAYQIHSDEKTGACAVVITGHDRLAECHCNTKLLS